MPKAAEAQERRKAAREQSEEWAELGLNARLHRIEEFVREGIRLQYEKTGNLQASLNIPDFDDAAKWQTFAITAEQVLAINARYYEREFIEPFKYDDVFCADPERCDNRNPRTSDAFTISRLMTTAHILFEDTAAQYNTPHDAIESFKAIAHKPRPEDTWPCGFAVDSNKWKTSLPLDRAAPEVCYENGDRIPPKTLKTLHYSDTAKDLRSPLCELDQKPDFSNLTPAEVARELKMRMLCVAACIRRNRDDNVTSAMFTSMIDRALRSEAIFRYLTPLRDLIGDELERRRGMESVFVRRVGGENGTEMAEVLLPYVELQAAIALKATCRALRDWCSSNGVVPRLAIMPPFENGDGFDASNFDRINGHSECEDTGAQEAVHGKMLTVQPVVYYQRLTIRPQQPLQQLSTHGTHNAGDKVFVDPRNDAATRFTITLVQDNAERTPVVGFGGASQASFGAAEYVEVCGKSARLKKRFLPEIKFAVFARPSKDWGYRRLRARITLHIACQDAHGRPQGEATLTSDSGPFLVIAREHSTSTKLLAKSRDREKARKRRMSKLSSRMQQGGERRQRAMDHANQQN